MFKTILFTLDLEHEATWTKALPVALDASRAWHAQLHLLTVVPEVAVPALMQAGPYDHQARLVPETKRALEQFVRAQVPAEVNAQQIVTYGSVYRQILEVAPVTVDLFRRPADGDRFFRLAAP